MNIAPDNQRFQDEGQYLHEFADKFLIVCPRCANRAEVLLAENMTFNPANHLFLPRKLTCSNCGYNQRWQSKTVFAGSPFDWYFKQSLWLQIACCGETLWAYNTAHLELIENYVAAKLRRRIPNKNSSLASRLPHANRHRKLAS